MSEKNRKAEYNRLIKAGREDDIVQRLKDEFGETAAQKKKHTEEELFALNKEKQVTILNGLGYTDIPRLEADRVKKILELQ